MKENPKISVIVPVYRVEKYLDRCVESIVNQTFGDFELILVDDGSPDNCPAMCDAWAQKDDRIRVIHKKNGGLSSARNAGMAKMTGKYVCFIDSDDWVETNTFEVLLELLKKYPQVQIAACNAQIERGTQGSVQQEEEEIRLYDQNKMLDFFFRIHGEASNTAVWYKMIIKTEILKGFTFVDTLNEDVEASYEFYTRATGMVETNQKLYHYFMNDTGITRSKFSRKDLDYLVVWNRIVERTQKEHPEYAEYAIASRKRANFTLLSKMMIRGYNKNDKELCAVHAQLKKKVRKDFFDLMKIKMPLSRKVLLLIEVL